MPREWNVYNIYPEGEGEFFNTPDFLHKLNDVRLSLENKLKKRRQQYEWFTLIYSEGGHRVKFGVVKRKGEENIYKEMEDELKKKYPTYTDLVVGDGDEKPENCELMAIATQCRMKLEEKIPISNWAEEDVSDLLHYMLNPCGRDFESWAHLLTLINIGDGVENEDLRRIIGCICSLLIQEDKIELRDNKLCLKR